MLSSAATSGGHSSTITAVPTRSRRAPRPGSRSARAWAPVAAQSSTTSTRSPVPISRVRTPRCCASPRWSAGTSAQVIGSAIGPPGARPGTPPRSRRPSARATSGPTRNPVTSGDTTTVGRSAAEQAGQAGAEAGQDARVPPPAGAVADQ